MNETEFNSKLRSVLRTQGLGVLHIREADQPGAADLVIWKDQRLLAWVELKIGDHEVEPQQWQFLEERVREGGEAYIIRLKTDFGRPFAVTMAVVKGNNHEAPVLGKHMDFHRVSWNQYFQ